MEERQAETLKELRAVFAAQKAEIEALGREALALGLPAETPPTLEQIEAAAPPEITAAVRGAAAEAEEVLAALRGRPKTKMPRKVYDTV